MKLPPRCWPPLFRQVTALVSLLWLTGCASTPQRQAYVLLDRYFEAHEEARQSQPPAAMLKISQEAARSEQALIAQRLAALKKEHKKAPRHISALQNIVAECEADLVVNLPEQELAVHVEALLPQATPALRTRILAWAKKQSPLALAAWRGDPNVRRFAEAVRQEKTGLAGKFREGLQQARGQADEKAFLAAVETLVAVAPHEPGGAELNKTLSAVMDAFSADMNARAENGQYWSLYTLCGQMLERAVQLQQGHGTEAIGRVVHDKAAQVREIRFQEVAEHILDLADKHSALWQQHGLALTLCDQAEAITRDAQDIPSRGRSDRPAGGVDRVRQAYREKAAEKMQRTVHVLEIRSPQYKEEAELLRLKIEEAVRQSLDKPPSGIWGIRLAPQNASPPDAPETRREGYVVGDGVLETARSPAPEVIEDIQRLYVSVYAPEEVYEVSRQKVVTHHVSAKTFRQEARLNGRFLIQHAGASEEIALALEDEHQYLVEQEDESLRETRFDPVPPAQKVKKYSPSVESSRDPVEMLNGLRDEAVEQVMEGLWKMAADYPAELEQAASACEQQNRWDLAAETWALLGEYQARLAQEKTDGRTAKKRAQAGERARARAAAAATRWLASREGETP